MMNPDYDLFVAIVREGSLSAAGRAIGLSPAMVSKRLQRLEEYLGVQLLYRSTRRIALTSRGESLHADLQRIMAALKDAEDRIAAGFDAPAGPLRISAPTSFGRMHFAPYLADFLERHPRIDVTLNLSDDFVDLVNEQVDLAIRITDRPPPGLASHRLATSERILCASPRYIDQHGQPETVEDLKRHRLLATHGQLPWRLTGPTGKMKVEGFSHVRTNSSEVVRELAIAGVGIALRSLWDVNEALGRGILRRVLSDTSGSSEIAIYALHLPSGHPHPAVDSMLAFLRELYSAKCPW